MNDIKHKLNFTKHKSIRTLRVTKFVRRIYSEGVEKAIEHYVIRSQTGSETFGQF